MSKRDDSPEAVARAWTIKNWGSEFSVEQRPIIDLIRAERRRAVRLLQTHEDRYGDIAVSFVARAILATRPRKGKR